MLFAREFQAIDRTDIEAICAEGFPESDSIEYKAYVPGRSGPDQWHSDQTRGISEYARDKLLAEIIGFSNSYGGHLLIGIEETETKPKRAAGVQLIPACADLADRLHQAASACVDPQIVGLQIKPIVLRNDGSGIVVARVPQSRFAPHRLESKQSATARHCYVRRGDSTESLTMREIQDHTLNLVRGLKAIDLKLVEFRYEFEEAISTSPQIEGAALAAVRCSAVPLQAFRLQREDVERAVRLTKTRFAVIHRSELEKDLVLPGNGRMRPIVRGARVHHVSGPEGRLCSHSVHMDGSQNLVFTQSGQASTDHAEKVAPTRIYIGWLQGAFASVLHMAQMLATMAKSSGTEHAIEMQIKCSEGSVIMKINEGTGVVLPYKEITFPKYPFAPDQGMVRLLDLSLGDILNSLEQQHDDYIVDLK